MYKKRSWNLNKPCIVYINENRDWPFSILLHIVKCNIILFSKQKEEKEKKKKNVIAADTDRIPVWSGLNPLIQRNEGSNSGLVRPKSADT